MLAEATNYMCLRIVNIKNNLKIQNYETTQNSLSNSLPVTPGKL